MKLATIFALLFVLISEPNTSAKSSATTKLPKPIAATVQAFLGKEQPDGKVKRVRTEKKRGHHVYEIVVSGSAKTFELEIAHDGRLLKTERDLKKSELPKSVRNALAKVSKGGKIKGIEWNRTARRESYKAVIVNRRGRKST